MNGVISSAKRKAETELSRSSDKLLKTKASTQESISGHGSSNKATISSKPATKPIARPTVQTSSSAPSIPYRGTGKPSPITPVTSDFKAMESKPAPKKGSYAEIMARGKVAQTSTAPVGAIKHKPKEKLSAKKELLLKKKGLLPNGKSAEITRSVAGSKPDSISPASQPGNGKIDVKKVPPAGYTGTAKPKTLTSYKGTMKPISSGQSPHKKPYPASSESDRSTIRRKPGLDSHRRRDSYSNEESEEDEGGYDSASDLSDMEAGFSDVEEEDERAAKQAKKEDEFELKMVEELKRQKEAKKRRLQDMAKKAQQRR